MTIVTGTSLVAKSYQPQADPVVNYCCGHTVKQTDLQKQLQDVTLKLSNSIMLGAPEVLSFGENFIRCFKMKRVLDIGTFTGASALAWASATPDDGEVLTFDIDHSNFEKYGVPIISKSPHLLRKIKTVKGEALKNLDKLINDGQSNQFDFAFIDADKQNYTNYYERVVHLLKPGGVLLVDNSLDEAKVCFESTRKDGPARAIHKMNERIFEDDRTFSSLVNLGDGIHIAFKK